jgi:hypothetical protein
MRVPFRGKSEQLALLFVRLRFHIDPETGEPYIYRRGFS